MAGWELSSAAGATWSACDVKGVNNLVQCGTTIATSVMFHILIILFCLTACWGLAALVMMTHGVWTGCEKVEASLISQALLVICDLQVINDSTLILSLFATPGVECQTTMMVEGIRGMDILEVHYFG